MAPDYPNAHWLAIKEPQRQGEKLALIREIVDVMPEPDMIHLLCEVFVTRCQGPLGNIVHTSTFMKQVEMLCACLGLVSPEKQIMAVSSTLSNGYTCLSPLGGAYATIIPRLKRVLMFPFLNGSVSLSRSIPTRLYSAGLLHL